MLSIQFVTRYLLVVFVLSLLGSSGVLDAQEDVGAGTGPTPGASGSARKPNVRNVGVGTQPIPGACMIFDGTREMLDEKWTYWEGPRFSSSLPIKWKIVPDPAASSDSVEPGTVLMSDDPAAAGGKYGAADIVTQQKYRDFRLHVEFLVPKPGGNSGVYLQTDTRSKSSMAIERSMGWLP